MTAHDDNRRSPSAGYSSGDRITIEKPNGDRLRREVIAAGKREQLGVWLTPVHWANLDALHGDGWALTSHEPHVRADPSSHDLGSDA